MAREQLSGREINDMLTQRVEDLVYFIFPAAKREGPRLTVGSLDGEPGKKLKIDIRGPKAGRWVNYGTSESDPHGKGDLIRLIELTIANGDIRKAFAEARRFLNLDTMDPKALERQRSRAKAAIARRAREAAQDDERRRFNAQGLWQAASPLTPSSPPVRYLENRGIDFGRLGRLPGAIRFHPKVNHPERGEKLPAMVTAFNALSGQHAATHVTYLQFSVSGWGKLPKMEVEGELRDVAKRIHGPAWALGAHMALWKGNQRCMLGKVAPGTSVYASEGIEDGLSYAMADPSVRVIAAGTLGLIGQVRLPAQAGDYVILAQNDLKPTPQQQLEDAIRAQQVRARQQGVVRRVLQKRPPQHLNDWNDWLNAGMAA